MRLSPNVLALLAGSLATASLGGCGGAAPRPEPQVNAPARVVVVANPPATVPPPTVTSVPQGPPHPEDYPVDCGRG